MTWSLPVEQYSPKDKDSFAYPTVVRRWPTILTNIISTISNETHRLHIELSSPETSNGLKETIGEKLEDGKEIIRKLSALKHDMGRDKVLEPIEHDGDINTECYNEQLKELAGGNDTWFTCTWLFAECYLYRRIRSLFAQTRHMKEYDPFFESKEETYKSSSNAIIHLAKSLKVLEGRKDFLERWEESDSALEIIFFEMIEAALWGNATDLSLLVDLKYEDLQKLQSVGKEAQAEKVKFILKNDLPRVWEHIKTLKDGRVDIVLDNAGFELYTDLIFADFLISHTPFVKEVVFHPKSIPWFVSDVTPHDFSWSIEALKDKEFFIKAADSIEAGDLEILSSQADRWSNHVETGRFKLSVPLDTKLGQPTPLGGFWTTQYPYQEMPEKDPGLFQELQKSDLVIFKGDLNYRKLLADGKWKSTTPFEDVIGPLNGKINVLSLRTNKADPIAGLPSGVDERLNVEAPDWRTSGRYAVVSFVSKSQ